MSLNSDFRNACIEHRYFTSNFTGQEYNNFDDLQVCHILSKSKRTLNSIKKAYGCSEKTAELIMNMPLLNTVIGSRQDNAEYKKTDDITYIDYNFIEIVDDILKNYNLYDNKDLNNINLINEFLIEVRFVLAKDLFKNNKNYSEYFKAIQLQFHKEIDLHI